MHRTCAGCVPGGCARRAALTGVRICFQLQPSLPEEYEEMDPKQQARARAQQLENRKLALNPNYVF